MSEEPKPCPGGGKQPEHTYSRQVRASGGVIVTVIAANCPVDHEKHYDLFVIGGKVAPHAL